jgi:hypothetical protein
MIAVTTDMAAVSGDLQLDVVSELRYHILENFTCVRKEALRKEVALRARKARPPAPGFCRFYENYIELYVTLT